MTARVDIFLMIFDFFRLGFPQYPPECADKPNGWTNDPNMVRRQEVIFEMQQGLICLENNSTAK